MGHFGAALIYLGGYFNHVLDHLPQWLDKFEGLLRRLYWTQAEIQINGGWMCASYVIEYQITQATANQFANDPANPVELGSAESLMHSVGPQRMIALRDFSEQSDFPQSPLNLKSVLPNTTRHDKASLVSRIDLDQPISV